MKVAVIGTQGVPAQYGGFETLVENLIGEKNSPEIHYTVFCSSRDFKKRLPDYKGALLKYTPFRANGVQSIPYDILSFIRAISGYDVVLVLGVSGCIFLPVFRLFSKAKVIVNIDGLEYRRGKWNRFAKRFLKFSESVAVRFAHTVIVDNKRIQDYVSDVYRRNSVLIAYGGDHALRRVTKEKEQKILSVYKLNPEQYSLAICRIEPENNCDLILEVFTQTGKQILFIGNWERNKYSRNIKRKYETFKNIRLIDSVYDIEQLYVLRKHCNCYLHGHSAGGTNPSLIEAMFSGCNILAFDCVFNKETTEYKASYFKNIDDLTNYICLANGNIDNNRAMEEIAYRRYKWESIINEYESLFLNLHQ